MRKVVLVLADGLIEADSQNPQFIVDCATLTGAAKVAVGNDTTVCFLWMMRW